MIKIVFVVEYRITNKDQTIDREGYKVFQTLEKAKEFLSKGLDEWDGTGKGIGNGQIKEEVRDYNEPTIPHNYDVIKSRVYCPLKNDKWYRYGWAREV